VIFENEKDIKEMRIPNDKINTWPIERHLAE